MQNITQKELNSVYGGVVRASSIVLRHEGDSVGYYGAMAGYIDVQDGEIMMNCDASAVLLNSTKSWKFNCANNLALSISKKSYYGTAYVQFN